LVHFCGSWIDCCYFHLELCYLHFCVIYTRLRYFLRVLYDLNLIWCLIYSIRVDGLSEHVRTSATCDIFSRRLKAELFVRCSSFKTTPKFVSLSDSIVILSFRIYQLCHVKQIEIIIIIIIYVIELYSVYWIMCRLWDEQCISWIMLFHE